MNKTLTRLLLMILVVAMLAGAQTAALAANKPYLPTDIEFAYKKAPDASNSYGFVIQNYTKNTVVKNLKSSNESVLKVSWTKNSGDCIDVDCLKPGKAVISCVLYEGSKKIGTFKVKATVYQYKSPVKSFKLGKIDYAANMKLNDQFYLDLDKPQKLKVSLKPNSGWKFEFIDFYDGKEMVTVKNNSVVSLKSGWNYVNAFFYNAKLNRSESVVIYVSIP